MRRASTALRGQRLAAILNDVIRRALCTSVPPHRVDSLKVDICVLIASYDETKIHITYYLQKIQNPQLHLQELPTRLASASADHTVCVWDVEVRYTASMLWCCVIHMVSVDAVGT